MPHPLRLGFLLVCLCSLIACDSLSPSASDTPTLLDLSDRWQVSLVAYDSIPDTIPTSPSFLSLIDLPGTLDEAGLGQRQEPDSGFSIATLAHFTRKRTFTGRAWYQLAVTIPNEWKGRRAILTLERVVWRSQLWVNGKKVGEQRSLSTPHRYVIDRLDTLTRGLHVLTLLVDNRDQFPSLHARDTLYTEASQSLTHAYTEHAQVKWNGVLGDISLEVEPDTGLQDVQVFPRPERREIYLTARSRHLPADQSWQVALIDLSADTVFWQQKLVPITSDSSDEASVTFTPPENMGLWTEARPQRYGIRVWPDSFPTLGGETTFGYRSVRMQDGRLLVNGQPIFLRGTQEFGLFPRTGYAPTDVDKWRAVMEQVKAYGFNYVHFPSWCPPEAAFEAADRLGLYLGVSLPVTSNSLTSDSVDSSAIMYLREEASRIQRAYGNHPSLVFLSPGIWPGRDRLPQDERILFWSDSLQMQQIPAYTMYPDMHPSDHASGILMPTSLQAVKDHATAKGLASEMTQMAANSGAWVLRLYQQAMQEALQDTGAAGFLLPYFQDYAGQGGHFGGLINTHREDKGLISPEEFRRLNQAVVPLATLPKRVWSASETFRASLGVANHLADSLTVAIHWSVETVDGLLLASDTLASDTLLWGWTGGMGEVLVPLDTLSSPTKCRLTVADGTRAMTWSFWVYPASVESTAEDKVVVVISRRAADAALAAGQSVLWQVGAELPTVPCGRIPWAGKALFPMESAPLLGLSFDAGHPALTGFPTAGHTDWQWASLLADSRALQLDSLPWTAVISVVDHPTQHRRLAVVAEDTTQNGRLILTTLDVTQTLSRRPAARALRESLLRYLAQ